ncbi:MAG: transketolase family protein [Bacillota bacterium]
MTTKIATRDAYGEALVELGKNNPNVVVLDADLSKSTKTAGFSKAYPDRFFNIGIAEANMMGIAAGLAASGKTPFASTFAMFATGRPYEQVRNTIGYPKLNVKIAATHAGLTVGEDGASHQAIEDISLMRVIPGMTVIVPADAEETKAAVKLSAEYHGPVYIRMGRSGVPVIHEQGLTMEWGKAMVLRQGKDVTLVATGIMVSVAMDAAQQLAGEGIEAEVVDVPFIKPFDAATISASAKKTGAVVTAEEHSIIGGLGSAVAEALAEHAPAPLERVGVKDTFGESGTPDALLKKYGLTAADIVEAAKRVLKRK